MRDLLSVVRQMQRDASPAEPPPSRKRRRLFMAGGLALFVALAAGALVFVNDWSGQHALELTHEQALRLAREGESTDPTGTLMVVLAAHAEKGINAIAAWESRGAQFEQQAHAAISRIEHVLEHAEPDRTLARRYPSWILFADALRTVRAVSEPGPSAWDSLEVVVYNIEECISLYHAEKDASGAPGTIARGLLTKLGSLVKNR